MGHAGSCVLRAGLDWGELPDEVVVYCATDDNELSWVKFDVPADTPMVLSVGLYNNFTIACSNAVMQAPWTVSVLDLTNGNVAQEPKTCPAPSLLGVMRSLGATSPATNKQPLSQQRQPMQMQEINKVAARSPQHSRTLLAQGGHVDATTATVVVRSPSDRARANTPLDAWKPHAAKQPHQTPAASSPVVAPPRQVEQEDNTTCGCPHRSLVASALYASHGRIACSPRWRAVPW